MENKLKRRNWAHGGSFKIALIEKIVKKIEKKFSNMISFLTLRNTVNGKGNNRVSLNVEYKKITLLLSHKYTKKSRQAKIIIGLSKDIKNEDLSLFASIFSIWIEKHA